MKKKTISAIVANLVFAILVASLLIWGISLVNLINTRIENSINEIETKIGQKIILQKDTLMIIDYSFFNSNYILEDGREVSFTFAEKAELVSH